MSEIDTHIKYEVHCNLRHAIPTDFKKLEGNDEIFKTGVVFFKKDVNFNFYGPFVTGEQYSPYDIKELLDEQSIFIML